MQNKNKEGLKETIKRVYEFFFLNPSDKKVIVH